MIYWSCVVLTVYFLYVRLRPILEHNHPTGMIWVEHYSLAQSKSKHCHRSIVRDLFIGLALSSSLIQIRDVVIQSYSVRYILAIFPDKIVSFITEKLSLLTYHISIN